MPTQLYGSRYQAVEWSFSSSRVYADPFNEVELDILLTDEMGHTQRQPAYWAGDSEWRVRFAPPATGAYLYRTVCSDAGNADLHGQEGVLEVGPYTGTNPLLQHGPLRVSENRRYLEHADGAPFFWLGDTWWMALCRRLAWPDEFQLLAADRVAKGFTVIQIVAGLYPDMPAYDPRGYNEAGHPWEPNYARINPAYFDLADLRIQWLIHAGLMPCIVGCWGYHLPWLGERKMKQHWRYLVARYGAYPVIWCLAGEGTMPYYLSEHKDQDRELLRHGWTELGRYVREIDGHHRLVTIHPTRFGREQVEDDTVLDVEMLQTGHSGYDSLSSTVETIRQAVAHEPPMPVVEDEVNYEGIMGASHQDVQRLIFWSSILSGAKGYTYGANGLWQLNRPEAPYGPSPHGAAWGDLPWQEAYRLPGGAQVAAGKRILERYPWQRLESRPAWVEPHADPGDYRQPYAAGIPGELRILYFPRALAPWMPPVLVRQLEPEITYRATLIDPRNGDRHPLGVVSGAESWRVPQPPLMQDWVLVLERA